MRHVSEGRAAPGGYSPDSMETDEVSRAGLWLARLTTAPALLLVAWLAVGLPLLMTRTFTLGLTFAAFLPVAVVVLVLGLRRVKPLPAPWWSVVALVAVAVGCVVLNAMMCAEQIFVRRDPASYFNYATWITGHASLPIPQLNWAFGGTDPALAFGGPAFYEQGHSLVPQFMAGTPIIVSAGGWIDGSYTMLGVMPVLGGLAVLCFGGLAARLVGARWAAPAALALGLAFPMMMVSRSIYSETGAMVLMAGGLCLLLDAVRTRRRWPALFGGLAVGLDVLVRIDGVRDVLPVIAFAGLLIGLRRRTGWPMLVGVLAGAAAGLVEGFTMSRPYLDDIHKSVHPMLMIAGAVLVATAVGAALVRWKGLPDLTRFRLPDAAVFLTVAVMVFFAARPWIQTVRRVPHSRNDSSNALYTAALQRSNGLPVDPNRLYEELSLHWVAWYIGIPAVLFATAGAALVARDLLRRRTAYWLLPFATFSWAIVTTLYRPAITPDQPWAGRRIVALVIPGMILFGLWAIARAGAYLRQRRPRLRPAAVLAGLVLLLVPTAWASHDVAFAKTERGEVKAADALCRSIGQRASVIIVSTTTSYQFSQVIRGMCGLPTGHIRTGPDGRAANSDVARVIAKTIAAGRRPIVLGARAADVLAFGPPRRVMHLRTGQDAHVLLHAPNRTGTLTFDIWLAEPVYNG